jgi:hypothetical protein
MKAPYFFGYGSLVNTATHDYHDPRPARLSGWRRTWAHTDLREVAFLTATPAPGHTIAGLIAAVPGADWDALDQREYAYDRLPASQAVDHDLPGAPEISVYAVPQTRQSPGSERHPILLSYLDVVLQGYLNVFGENGAVAFMQTTDGWEAPILDDRSAPIYPRHQTISTKERALFDALIEEVGARRIPLQQ